MTAAPRRFALLVAYHGRGLLGFARQAGGPTVQQALEEAWLAVRGETVVMHGSGRTDAGVHAWGQVVHFTTFRPLPPRRMRDALDAHLPRNVTVRACAEVSPGFHARRSAVGKHYLYRIALGPHRPVLDQDTRAFLPGALDLAAMRRAARALVGRRDFAALAAAGRTVRDTVRRVDAVHLREVRDGLVVHVRGEGFLYKMVRNLVGTLVEVGRGRRDPRWVEAVLASGDRRRAGATAPPEGLVLWRVHYREDPFRGLAAARRRPYPGGPGAAPPAPGPQA